MIRTAQTTDALLADAYFPALSEHIISATGLVFYANRPEALANHLADRLSKRGLSDCGTYLQLLHDEHGGDGELDELIALLTIGETYFFRHSELFDALGDVALPEIIRRNRMTKRVRVWCAGCSTGPEAYSVSILLRRDLEDSIRGWNVSILGTDINRSFLARATEGRYEEWAFRGTRPDLRQECFEKHDASWRIAPRFREGVTFQYHNLMRHPFPSLVHDLATFDLILCRNVLIYFAPEIVERIVSQLAECLVPGGWLAVGHAEHGAPPEAALEAVPCRGATLYQRSEPGTPRTANEPVPSRQEPTRAVSFGSRVSSIGSQVPNPEPPNPIPAAGIREGAYRPGLGPERARVENQSRASCDRSEVARIRTFADEGNLEAAMQLCARMLAKNPLDPKGYFYQALLLDQVAGHDAALEALGKAIYLDREFDVAHYYLGLIQQKLGNVPGAMKSFRNVLRLFAGRDPSERLPDADGMTVADLQELTQMHMETLEQS